jgi:hypothetical protein
MYVFNFFYKMLSFERLYKYIDMNIPVFPFEEATELKPNNPFPNYISEDPNVLYHGTSSLYEQSIENTGLCVNTSTFTKEEIEEVCTLFDCVKWPNKRFWSESNLRNYTLNHDFKNPDLKPLYLAECSERASLYASIEFAGGEIARAVRNTFKDLEKLINDPQELVKEKEAIERDTLYTGRTVLDYDLSLDILQLKLKELKSYKEKAAISLENFQYGLIYAVKFSPR